MSWWGAAGGGALKARWRGAGGTRAAHAHTYRDRDGQSQAGQVSVSPFHELCVCVVVGQCV